MACHDHDSDLVLFANRELGPLRSALVQSHLLHCGRCRARLGEFTAVSALFSRALGPLPAHRPIARHPRVGPAPGVGSVAPFVVAMAVTTMVASVVSYVSRSSSAPPPQQRGAPVLIRGEIGCTSGLPNDRCR